MIPVFAPLIMEREKELVRECLDSGWISSSGQYIKQFEQGWARYCGMKHGIAVCNGTAALQTAVRMLDLKPGDEVIMPAFTIISCAQAVTAVGGLPVLVDSDPRNWQMDVSQMENRITKRTRAVMVVHIYGHPADMDAIKSVAERNGLAIIEDAAEVHGAEYKGKKCGGFGDISIFSFYANKLVTCGEGGMVLTNRDGLAEKARSLINLCFQPGRRFHHEEIGYNFRMTNLQAAIGVAQMERIETTVQRKRAIAGAYALRLRDMSGLSLPVEEQWAKSVYWVYGIVIDDALKMTAADLARKLEQKGIETRPFFLGMHEQPAFQKMGLFRGERYPVAERLARQGLYLPSGLAITEDQIDEICTAIRQSIS